MNLEKCTKAQGDVITTLDAPLMVSAGAGSGKTFTLTQRVAYALSPQEGQPPFLDSVDQLLAITFTTKAAEELKSRIKGLLLDEDLTEEALKADDAWVSTIHGMASRILREHALEIGVDPAFEVIADAEAEELLDQALEEVIRQVRSSGDSQLAKLLRDEKLRGSGFNDKGLVDYVKAVYERVHAMPDGFNALVVDERVESPAALMGQLEKAADTLAAELPALKVPGKAATTFLDQLADALEKMRAWQNGPGANGAAFTDEAFDVESFCQAFYAVPRTMRGRLSAEYQEAMASWWETLVDLDSQVRVSLCVRWRDAIVSVARMIDEAFRTLKGPGRLDNTDLLLRCAEALREHPAIAEELRRKFKLIMVDEFQDTDRLQVDIISRLAQPGLSNVCTVGDAQQSIYRFRGADVNVFTEYRRNLAQTASEDSLKSMAVNFRSHGDVLAFVERFFSQPEVFGADFLRLEAGGDVNKEADPLFDGRPRIQVDVVHGESGKATIDDARRASARAVAKHFAELRDAGASVGDMVILLGAMSHADTYAEALRAQNIDSMIAGGSVFSRMPEPKLVLNLLRVAVNAADEEALYPVLVSPLFAVGDDALLALASRKDEAGRWVHSSLARGFAASGMEGALAAAGLPDAQIRAVASCRELLRRFAARAQEGSPAEALRRLLVESGLLDRLQRQGVEGTASAANFAKAVRLVQDVEESATGLASAAAAFKAHLETAKEAPGALATASGEFVRIMTVHASKGLEFPHVAVAELRDGRESAGRLVVENVGEHTYASAAFVPLAEWEDASKKVRGLADKVEDVEPFDISSVDPTRLDDALARITPGERHQALAAFTQEQALAEARRLLYVALTRASKSLFVAIALGNNPAKGYENKGIVEDMYRALSWDTAGARAVTMVDYGGSAPAKVTLTALGQLADEEAGSADEPDGAASADALEEAVEIELGGTVDSSKHDAFSETAEPFVVPVRVLPLEPMMVPRNFAHAGLFSYSSISGTHEHTDQPVAPADKAAVAVVGASDPWEEEAEGAASVWDKDVCGAIGDASITSNASAQLDSPRKDATALGRAFHRLAQQAIERSILGALFEPGEAAVEAQIQKEQLSSGQQERLRSALDRWLSSDEAARFASHESRSAEVPFTVAIGDFFLEGEIDGLADNGDGAAFLIDYKTGGHDDETAEQLDAKHRLQASCYAYALMRAGYTSVDAHFLRIERSSAENPRDLQIVPYHFETTDLPALEALIIERQKEAVAQR